MDFFAIDAKWSSGARRWFSSVVPNLLGNATRRASSGIQNAINEYIDDVRAWAPHSGTSPPNISDDWTLQHIEILPGGLSGGAGSRFLSATIGSDRSQPDFESKDKGTSPFNVPWGIHDGIEKHNVWIYLPDSAPDGGRVRQKLAEFVMQGYYRQGMGWREVADILRKQMKKAPFITVHGHGATEYAFGGPSHALLHSLGNMILEDMGDGFASEWMR